MQRLKMPPFYPQAFPPGYAPGYPPGYPHYPMPYAAGYPYCKPEPIEEYDEYSQNRQDQFADHGGMYPEGGDAVCDDQSSSGGNVMRTGRPSAAQQRSQQAGQSNVKQPMVTSSNAVVTTSDSTVTTNQKQMYTSNTLPTNLLEAQQFFNSMIELKIELFNEFHKLSNKIGNIDEHILEFAKIR